MIFWAAFGSLVVALAALAVIPRWLIHRSQDRLAEELITRDGAAWLLLTRAERLAGQYRRIPGVIGIQGNFIVFASRHEPPLEIPVSSIQKIITGNVLSSGRRLLRDEALRIGREPGPEVEFQMSRASAYAWRSHLGLWVASKRHRDAETVTPGKS